MAPAIAPVTLAMVAGACSADRVVDPAQAAALFERVTLDTRGANGLSGLALAGDGALWTVAERGRALFRVELAPATTPVVERFPVAGADGDLEALAWSPGDGPAGTFWMGLEETGSHAEIVRLARVGDGFEVVDTVKLGREQVGLEVGHNHGVEGLCAARGRVIAAIESVGKDARGRWAPVVVLEPGARVALAARYRLRLTTATGKISGLDCWPAADGGIEALAIERHFAVTRLLRFTIPAPPEGTGGADGAGSAPGPAAADGDRELQPQVALDLASAVRGALNLEGIVRMADGRWVAVVDNQYGRITGPNELLVGRARP